MFEVLRASIAIRCSTTRRQCHSQLDNHLVYGTCASRPPAETVVMEEAHAATASISRTHSQCQRGAEAPSPHAEACEDLVFIPGKLKAGGAYRDRTDDLKLAKLALSQLS
jgi:hypothetical protein